MKDEHKQNLLKLAERIEGEPMVHGRADKRGFSMFHVFHVCGSPSCIAGYGLALFEDTIHPAASKRSIYDMAEKNLGLSFDEAEALFYPPHFIDWTLITPATAAQHLRDIADGQPIDWKRYFP